MTLESVIENAIGAASDKTSRDDDTTLLIKRYLTQNNYRSLIAVSLVFIFSIVFYLIYLLVDVLIDKQKHHELCVKSLERYEKRLRAKRQSSISKQRGDDQIPVVVVDNANKTGDDDIGMAKDIELGEHDDNESTNIRIQSKSNKTMSERDLKLAFTDWSMRNLQISFIHSVLSSLWLIRILIVRFDPLFADLIFYVSWDTYLLIAFSCGYFLYDFYDIFAAGYVKREWVVCVHHVIVLITFIYHLSALQSIGYTCLALSMEFNSVFLHARKLLSFYMFGRRSPPFLVNLACNVTTFVVFRFGGLALIYFGVYFDGSRVSVPYLVGLVTLVTIMAIINIFLFKRIVQRDVLPLLCGPNSLRKMRKSGSKKKKIVNEATGEEFGSPIDDKSLMVDHHGHMLTCDNAPIINNAQSNVVLVLVE